MKERCIEMNEKEIRRVQIMELILFQLKEDKKIIDDINESFKNEVGEDLNLREEEIDEMLEIIRKTIQE